MRDHWGHRRDDGLYGALPIISNNGQNEGGEVLHSSIHQISNHILKTYNSNVQWLSGNEEYSSPLEMPRHMAWVNSKWFEETDSFFALSQIKNDWYLPSALLSILPFLTWLLKCPGLCQKGPQIIPKVQILSERL